jgi:catechol 2,3-dioxygenase-like lactoylglutathione lyase family enzyme
MEQVMKKVTLLLPLVATLLCSCQVTTVNEESNAAMDINPAANVKDTSTSILGLNHIGLSVKDLDKTLAFYQEATNFEVVSRETVSQNKDADLLFGHPGIVYEAAVLKAPNMLLELIEFEHNKDAEISHMPAKGPGMTHTCYQSPASNPGWDKFANAGATPLTWGGKPVDLGGYGVTYGYAYDPEGNMMELEQLDGEILTRSGYDTTWKVMGVDMWMTQVALVTHDIERFMSFYYGVLGFEPYRKAVLQDNAKADQIVGYEDSHVLAGWFKMNETSKMIEIWQYVNPVTTEFTGTRDVTDLGYSFSLEVGDIQKEYQRLTDLGLEFVSEPVKLGEFWQAYTHDVDGNVFSLRQAIDADSELSVRKLDRN